MSDAAPEFGEKWLVMINCDFIIVNSMNFQTGYHNKKCFVKE